MILVLVTIVVIVLVFIMVIFIVIPFPFLAPAENLLGVLIPPLIKGKWRLFKLHTFVVALDGGHCELGLPWDLILPFPFADCARSFLGLSSWICGLIRWLFLVLLLGRSSKILLCRADLLKLGTAEDCMLWRLDLPELRTADRLMLGRLQELLLGRSDQSLIGGSSELKVGRVVLGWCIRSIR
jgi:hypothetical protein